MAMRRMFSKEVTDSDAFVDMPLSSQALYFHLGMVADDDGFINNPKKVQRGVGASNDDMALLFAKGFVIPFESGVVVIKHWRINNYIQNDRHHPTKYQDEYATLFEKTNGAYSLTKQAPDQDVYNMDTGCIQDASKVDTEVRLGKVRLGEVREEEGACARGGQEKAEKHGHGEFSNVMLTDAELEQLKSRFPNDWKSRIDDLSFYIGSTGKKYKSHYRTLLSWDRRDRQAAPRKEVKLDARYAKYD